MKALFICVLNLLIVAYASPQKQPAVLLGESGDGKTVKLIWFVKSWDKNLQGFDIKRRSGSNRKDNWQKLNMTAIVPEVSVSKDLSNVEPDAGEQGRLITKLQSLVSQKKAKEVSTPAYVGRLTTDTNALRAVAVTITLDYDLALINGFGLVDRTAAVGNTYEYGLFSIMNGVSADQPLATFTWTSGTKAALDPPVKITSEVMAKPYKIQLKWTTTGALVNNYVAGFNVYKKQGSEWVKLNTSPVNTPTGKAYLFSDNTATPNAAITYAVGLVSIFGNEGNKASYTYDPSIIPAEYKAAELAEIKPAGDNFKSGFSLQWTFPNDYEKYIKGFIIEKNNMPGGFKQASTVLAANTRSFNENTFSPPASYINFRVIAVYNDSTRVNGNERMFYFLPVIYAPKPQHLAGKWFKEGDKTYIDLSWDAKAPNDTLTKGYQLYATSPQNGKMYWENSIPLIKETHYRYPVFHNKATPYSFAIAAVSRYKWVGLFSDTITVEAPTTSLPTPVIYPYTVDSSKVTLNWNYPDIVDLKGFRVYQNGNMVASEFELKKDARRFISPILKKGATFLFAIKAVTESGVESDLSIQREVYIEK